MMKVQTFTVLNLCIEADANSMCIVSLALCRLNADHDEHGPERNDDKADKMIGKWEWLICCVCGTLLVQIVRSLH